RAGDTRATSCRLSQARQQTTSAFLRGLALNLPPRVHGHGGEMPQPTLRLVLAAQGAYYLVGGLWPLLHYRSFEAVTGKKKDAWLVKTVASMILAVVATHARALREPRTAEAARVAGVGAGVALGWAAAWYPLRGRIAKV